MPAMASVEASLAAVARVERLVAALLEAGLQAAAATAAAASEAAEWAVETRAAATSVAAAMAEEAVASVAMAAAALAVDRAAVLVGLAGMGTMVCRGCHCSLRRVECASCAGRSIGWPAPLF